MALTTATEDASATTPALAPGQRFAEVLLILVVFFAAAGNRPPEVNEPHYLTRLKHFWNPAWCAGDVFLESPDTQVVLIWLFGWVTRWLSLTATAWLGRVLVWTFLAWAWQRLSWRLVPRPLASVLSAALFVLLNDRAQFAGEWVVGGVEAKGFAYAFVLWALREMADRRWNRMWLLLGTATAFHPLVGGWSVLICGGVWLIDFWKSARTDSSSRRGGSLAIPRAIVAMLPGLIGGGLLGLLGVVPALALTWNDPPEIVAEASRIYVFNRLPHHLAPLTLPRGEIARYLIRHAVVLATLFALTRALRKGDSDDSGDLLNSQRRSALLGIAYFAWGAAAIAAIGFAIEIVLWNHPLAAARLLRYYWFRMSDFAAPMAVALCVTAFTVEALERRRAWAAWALAAALLLTTWHLADAARLRWLDPTPPADAKTRDFAAWVDACDWVAKNTPPDAMFLTPRLNLSFKWRAGRPEVVNRKDIPQDARGIVEWHRRLKDIYYMDLGGIEQPLDSLGILGTERVRELALKYGADYVIMDRSQLLSLPKEYWNEEYVVYRIGEAPATDGQ